MFWPFRAPRQPLPSSHSPAPETHPLVAGFRISEPMGTGPLGTVYRAKHEETGAFAVFRGFTRPTDADPDQWERAKAQFRDLLTAHQKIDNHPNIQKILGFGEENGLFWIAAEYFEGVTLQSIVTTKGAQSLPWARAIFTQIASAVDWAAERGLCHTDLTPFNVLFVRSEAARSDDVPPADSITVKVINFGLAHARVKYGSPYAAPEQMDGFDGNRQSDVYGMGALLYAMLSGRPPFAGATPEEIARAIQTATYAPLRTRPAYVQQILAKMLDKTAERRYPTVRQAWEDLENQRGPSAASPDIAPAFGAPFPVSSAPTALSTAVQTEDTTDGRFARLELDTSASTPNPVAAERGRGRRKPAGTSFEGRAGHVALQDFRLSGQDLIEVRARLEKERILRQEAINERRGRIISRLKTGCVGASGLALLWHASSIPQHYRYATVVGQTGEAFIRQGNRKLPLHTGMHFQLAGLPQGGTTTIVTGQHGRLLLELPGARLHLREDASLVVRQAEYRSGPVRRFELERGQVTARIDPRHRASAVFEIASHGVRAIAKGTVFFMSHWESGGTDQVQVATQEGTVRVVLGNALALVGKGEQVQTAVGSNTMPDAVPIEKSVHAQIMGSEQTMNGVKQRPAIAAFLSSTEEGVLLPIAEAVGTAAHLPSYLSDRRAQVQAVGAMQALCTLIQTAETADHALPDSIDPKTLKELGLKPEDSARLLEQFDGHCLLDYRVLPNDEYEVLAKANDTEHHLVRGRNGIAQLVGNDDTEFMTESKNDKTK